MSSKYSTTAPTHKPLPWCNKLNPFPFIPVGLYPFFVNAYLRFYSMSPPGFPHDKCFYLRHIALTATGHGAASVTEWGYTAALSIWYDAPNKRFVASADLFGPSGPIAVLQTTVVPVLHGRPLVVEIWHFTGGIPVGQDGRLKVWE